MSEISSRPRVRSVASRAVVAHLRGCVAVGAVVAPALRELARKALAIQPSIECPRLDRIIGSPEAAICLTQMRVDATAHIAPGADRVVAEKTAALLAVFQAPLAVRPAAITAQVERLVEASTSEAVQQAELDLVHAVKLENSHVMSEALVAASRQASVDAGFVNVEMTVGARGVRRVVATDASGRALVTEIHRGDDTRAPSVETEVVGFTDGRCHAILDRYDAAMDAQGVTTEASAERRWTGGVCELKMARDFIREKVAPAVRRSESRRIAPTRRAQRLRTVKQGGR